jgi:HSP20 family protein
MATFFDKITGSRKSPPSETLKIVPPMEEARRDRRGSVVAVPPREAVRETASEERPHHLRVAEEDSPAPQGRDSAAEEQPEEEGELTIDIYDRGDAIMIQSTVAGVKPEDLDVSITNDTVSIQGKRERPEPVDEKDYYYKELFWGTFSRSVILPEEVEDENAEATLKFGLLTIRLPKKRRGVVQRLKVKVT